MAATAVTKLAGAARPAALATVLKALNTVAPRSLAAKWDNVGLLLDTMVPSYASPFVVFLTNDLTEKVVDEAVEKGSNLIVTYHPTPFRGVKRVVREETVGRVMLKCLSHGVAVYSTHTSLDAVPGGVNDWLIKGLGEGDVVPAVPDDSVEGAGMGRVMTLSSPSTLADVIARTKAHLNLPHIRVAVKQTALPDLAATGETVSKVAEDIEVGSIAVCAGSGSSVLRGISADVWVTGEMSHHEVLAATAEGISVVLTDHSNTERGYLPVMAERLTKAVAALDPELADGGLSVVLTTVDADPLVVV